MKFVQLILKKIIKIVATRCQILRLICIMLWLFAANKVVYKMHQIRFRLGLRPRPRWGAYSAPQTP